jgi:hypothetical protein
MTRNLYYVTIEYQESDPNSLELKVGEKVTINVKEKEITS